MPAAATFEPLARTISYEDDGEELPQLCRTESRCLSEPCSDSRAYMPKPALEPKPEPKPEACGPVPEPEVHVESRPYDSTQEMRAMILTALPFPPLPVCVQRIELDDGRIGAEVVQTSHDVLSNLLLHACARKDSRENQERKKRQLSILRSLLDRMCCRGQLQSVPELYENYCYHTLGHILTYLPPEAPMPSMRFMPLGTVCKGDPTHRRMCDYMAGQAVLFGEPNGTSAQDWLCREYADMLLMARNRLVNEREPNSRYEDEDEEGVQEAIQSSLGAGGGDGPRALSKA